MNGLSFYFIEGMVRRTQFSPLEGARGATAYPEFIFLEKGCKRCFLRQLLARCVFVCLLLGFSFVFFPFFCISFMFFFFFGYQSPDKEGM